MVNQANSPKEKSEERPLSTTHDSHDITSLADLPGKKIKTKLWPMSPIESLSADEVMAIAYRDHTPIMIGRVLDGDDKGEQYVCASKKGASLPPEIAAEGSWAQKYYQQVVVLNDRVKNLNDTMKDMQERFQPVWELAKGQQVLSVSVEVFDGLLAVVNEGFHQLYNTWTKEDKKSIITKECDFRSPHFANYYSVLKNYSMGRFSSLDPGTFRYVEDLLDAGEQYLINHARMNGFHCPFNVRALIQQFIPLKSDRNRYSHPLSLSDKSLATTVLARLRVAVTNDEFDFMKDSKNLILLGTDYAESVLHSYGKVKEAHFMDPKRRSKQRQGTKSTTPPGSSPEDSPPHSPLRPRSPDFPLFGLERFQSGQSSPIRQSSPIPCSPQTSPNQIQSRSKVVIPIQSSNILNPSALEFIPSHNHSPISPPSLQTSPSSGSSQGSQSPPSQHPQHLLVGFKTQQTPTMNHNQHGSQNPTTQQHDYSSQNAQTNHPQQASQETSTQQSNSHQGGGSSSRRNSKRSSPRSGQPSEQYYHPKRPRQ